jgi:hypothetical protein
LGDASSECLHYLLSSVDPWHNFSPVHWFLLAHEEIHPPLYVMLTCSINSSKSLSFTRWQSIHQPLFEKDQLILLNDYLATLPLSDVEWLKTPVSQVTESTPLMTICLS